MNIKKSLMILNLQKILKKVIFDLNNAKDIKKKLLKI